MALTLPKLAIPKLELDKKKLPAIVGGVIVLVAAGWFGWQYFMEEPPPPPPKKSQAVKAAKPSAPAKAADTGQARDKLIAEILAATGVKQQLDQLPGRLLAGARQSGKERPKAAPAKFKAIEDAMAKSFTAEGFQKQVAAGLNKNFDQKRFEALLKDYSTPTGKNMIALERSTASADALALFAKSAAATKPTPERAALIKGIDAATKASDLAVEAAFVSMKALASGMAGKAASVDKTIESQRAVLTGKIHAATLLNLAYSFKDTNDADLAKYAAIYEAENSKWFYGLVYASLLEEVENASVEAGKMLGEGTPAPSGKRTREPASAPAAAKHAGSKSGADARACLDLADNAAIRKCAEDYR